MNLVRTENARLMSSQSYTLENCGNIHSLLPLQNSLQGPQTVKAELLLKSLKGHS